MGMTIGEIATRAGVPTATIRYYESRGLIPEVPRTSSGYRRYEENAAVRLRFIKRAQDLGFSLDDVQELLELRVDDGSTCSAVAAKVRQKRDLVRQKIGDLQRMQDALESLAACCADRRATTDCPILDLLTQERTDA